MSGSVSVGDQLVSQIGKGLVVLLGVIDINTHRSMKKTLNRLLRNWHKNYQKLDCGKRRVKHGMEVVLIWIMRY